MHTLAQRKSSLHNTSLGLLIYFLSLLVAMNPSAHQIPNPLRKTPSIPFDKAPTATSRVQYEADTEKSNDDLRHVFNDHMNKTGHYMTSSFYKKVKCLLISWDDDCDDLHTGPEVGFLHDNSSSRLMVQVAELANVLENKMHFKVTRALLTNDGDHLAHLQVVHHIVNFIWAEDGPQTLLMFYYAGHGSPKSMRGGSHGLTLTGFVYSLSIPYDANIGQ